MNRTAALLGLSFFLGAAHGAAAEIRIVENGRPRAEIVVAENAGRSARLAAQELQDGLRKISGARLPIVTTPDPATTHLFVGRSPHTDRLQVFADDLPNGAYRLQSVDAGLVLIGQDTEFTPIEPWGKNNSELVSRRPEAEWRRLTGSLWRLPNALLYKDRTFVHGDTGLPDDRRSTAPKTLEIWAQDERGSFNAVCGFLGHLGMRWYAPGELGEVLPSLPTIALPTLNETVRPDFAIRRFNVRFAVHGENMTRWAMRLGLRDPYGVEAAHGMDNITDNEETFAAHPEWFALYGGKRRYQRGANNHLCYSNEELFRETVRYVRAVLDHYQYDMVSVMPPDGYTAICQCPKCVGKDSPEREQQGLASDYVWDFVNRVAKEVRKTHPDKKVINCAYGIYSSPPLKIDRLEPNVVVSIVGGRRPMSNKPEQQAEFRKLRESWLPKTSNPIVIFENYPFTDRGWYLPSFTPHSLGSSINAAKGYSQGEDIWLSLYQEIQKDQGAGLNPFLIYFTQRMYWGGKHADVDALFREYVRLFYGPAEAEMNAFFDFCEANWQETEKEKDKADRALALFAAAKAKVDPSSVYGRRLALVDDYLQGLRHKSAQLGRLRGPTPTLRLVGPPRGKIVIDGRLDDDAWSNCPAAATCRLQELQTGRRPIFGTTVKAAWLANDLYFAIRCDEPRGEKLNVGTTRKDDSALWYGDAVEVLVETEAHSYYQIAVAPSGAVCDLDRGASRDKWFTWDAKAEVAVHVADDHWTVELRLPVRPDDTDPLNQIVGKRPTRSLPWHVNICRQRVRDDGSEFSAFSPTGIDGFHDAMKFATFFDGNSYEFEHGPPDDDFLAAVRSAEGLARTGKRAAALEAYQAAAERKATDFQKSYALEPAAGYARGEKRPDLAEQLIARIPIPAVRKSATMQHLIETGRAAECVASFADEDFSTWPFWKRGDGLHARGRAYFYRNDGPQAERDLSAALLWTSEPRTREAILLALGRNRESNLRDDVRAREAYAAIVADRLQIGGADEFAALQGMARIDVRAGRFAEALATLDRAQVARLQGVWRSEILLSLAEVHRAAGRPDEARSALRSILDDPQAESRHRRAAEERLQAP